MSTKITVPAAAALLGVTPQRVRALIKAGMLEAEKWGRDWQIDAESVEKRRKGMGKKKEGALKAPSSHSTPSISPPVERFRHDGHFIPLNSISFNLWHSGGMIQNTFHTSPTPATKSPSPRWSKPYPANTPKPGPFARRSSRFHPARSSLIDASIASTRLSHAAISSSVRVFRSSYPCRHVSRSSR